MLLRCCAACPPSGSPRATARRSVRFISIRVSAFCPPYDSARAEHALALDKSLLDHELARLAVIALDEPLAEQQLSRVMQQRRAAADHHAVMRGLERREA